MRLWSIHPKYLDAKGILAVWREGILAKKVLEGKTKGYKNHPQLIRFKNSVDPLNSINYYLQEIYKESVLRGYNFSSKKIDLSGDKLSTISVTKGQIEYESQHLKNKLKIRDKERFNKINNEIILDPHNLFHIVSGQIELWEKLA